MYINQKKSNSNNENLDKKKSRSKPKIINNNEIQSNINKFNNAISSKSTTNILGNLETKATLLKKLQESDQEINMLNAILEQRNLKLLKLNIDLEKENCKIKLKKLVDSYNYISKKLRKKCTFYRMKLDKLEQGNITKKEHLQKVEEEEYKFKQEKINVLDKLIDCRALLGKLDTESNASLFNSDYYSMSFRNNETTGKNIINNIEENKNDLNSSFKTSVIDIEKYDRKNVKIFHDIKLIDKSKN